MPLVLLWATIFVCQVMRGLVGAQLGVAFFLYSVTSVVLIRVVFSTTVTYSKTYTVTSLVKGENADVPFMPIL